MTSTVAITTTPASANGGPRPPASYSWKAEGKPAEVRIEFGCMSRLLGEILRGFGVLPRRGVEMGGLLLGWVERISGSEFVVHVEDFEPVPCRHARGAAWLLSDEEQIVFEDTLSRWHRSEVISSPAKRTYAVGFYRSHTREGMAMTEEDVDLYRRCFPEATSIFLLVKPFATRSSVGAIFFRENGKLRSDESHLEFPFDPRELGAPEEDLPPAQRAPLPSPPLERVNRSFYIPSRDAVADTPNPAGMSPSQNNSPRPEMGDNSGDTPFMAAASQMITQDQLSFGIPTATREPATGKRSRSGWVWLPLSFVFLLVGVGLGMFVALSVGSQLPGPLRHDPYSLGLTVSPSPDSLLVRWDRSSSAIQRAARATLLINDGGAEKAVPLDRLQLQTGSVLYRNSPDRVKLRLEVEARDGVLLTESLDFQK